jgi:DNA (cytosine-5)-methyltransferase 1
LAGCAPCQPFSPYRRGLDTSAEEHWPLLREFGRLVRESLPELVTMENVPRIGSARVFQEFVEELRALDYSVSWRSCYGPEYGLPQNRRRLILVASRLGPIIVPEGTVSADAYRTVRQAIGDLPPLASGGQDTNDPLHRARELSPLNSSRIRASRPGGTWRDWPRELLAPCHRKASGSSFGNVYARMEWDKPSPTITTLAHNFGAGRFGHPEQHRPISLREAAVLQGFDRDYAFVADDADVNFSRLGRLIGNAVPPPLGSAVGRQFVEHVASLFAAVPEVAA